MTGKIRRRSLILGLGSLALTQLLSACQFWQQPPQFLVEFLASSIPAPLLKKFQGQIGDRAKLRPLPIAQLSDGSLTAAVTVGNSNNPINALGRGIRERLPFLSSRNSGQKAMPDIVSLGDSWLQNKIQNEQLAPLEFSQESAWKNLPSTFRALVTRNDQGLPDLNGQIWGAPYRWGHLMIAYRVDQMAQIGQELTKWNDLWQDDLKGRISLPDSDRIVLGIALKSQEQSINTPSLDAVPNLKERLADLNQQVKFYSSDSYLQPLLLKDTWVAVGWSTDILPLVRRDRRINAVVPQSGTILTADVWVTPRRTEASEAEFAEAEASSQNNPTHASESSSVQDLAYQWIDFFWEPSVATQLSLLSPGASPMMLMSHRELPSALSNDQLLIPPDSIMQKSEFLEPLSDETLDLYRNYWQEMRRS